MKDLHAFARKTFLTLYRWSALVLLYGILIAIIAYVSTMLFYLCSTAWVAPVLISPSNTQILTLTETLVSSNGAIDAFVLDRDRQQVTVNELAQQKNALERLDHELGLAISQARSSDFVSGTALNNLGQEKQHDIAVTEPLTREAAKVGLEIEADLRAGLISKADAQVQRATLNQFTNTLTDDKIAAVLLHDTTRQKLQTDLATVDAIAQRAQIDAQIASFAVQIVTGREQMKSDDAQITRLRAAMTIAEATPYYRASVSPNMLAFAFTPYANEQSVAVGTPLYDCYVGLIGCYRVGTVERVFSDEEHQQNPLLHNDVRGFLVQLSLYHSKAAKSTVLFTRKPFGI